MWSADHGWLVEVLAADIAADRTVVLVAETGPVDTPTVVSAAWLRVTEGTEFAGLWGGSTLAEWRGRGIYRLLVARLPTWRSSAASVTCGWTRRRVSASILRRIGLLAVATTTLYVWSPSTQDAS